MTLEGIPVENLVPGGYSRAGQDFLGHLQVAIHVVQNPPRWRAKVALGQDKKRKLPFQMSVCLLFVFSQCDFCSPERRFCTR